MHECVVSKVLHQLQKWTESGVYVLVFEDTKISKGTFHDVVPVSESARIPKAQWILKYPYWTPPLKGKHGDNSSLQPWIFPL